MLWQLLISFCQDDECGSHLSLCAGVPMSADNEGSSICALDRAHQKSVYKALQEEITKQSLALVVWRRLFFMHRNERTMAFSCVQLCEKFVHLSRFFAWQDGKKPGKIVHDNEHLQRSFPHKPNEKVLMWNSFQDQRWRPRPTLL